MQDLSDQDGRTITAVSSGEKLHKYIARCGVTSRRKAELLIISGKVSVDGKIITNPAERIIPTAFKVSVYGKIISPQPALMAYVFYKPPMCVSTLSDPQGRLTIKDFFPKTKARLFPVGRLDYDAQGLMIITNDGELAQAISHPSKNVSKLYFVKVDGLLSRSQVERLDKRPVIDGKKVMPVRYKFIRSINNKTWIEVILREGINRQIKKMFAEFGYQVLKIKRIAVGPVHLENLRQGEMRPMSEAEKQFFLQR